MQHIQLLSFLFFFAAVLQIQTVFSQSVSPAEEKQRIIAYTKQKYGTDDILVNGVLYVPEHYLAEGHPCLLTDEFSSGTVFIKDKKYGNEQLKYDIEKDEFVLRAKTAGNSSKDIVLYSTLVDSIYFLNRRFVNARFIPTDEIEAGYYEMIYNNKQRKIYLFIDHYKNFKPDYTQNTPYGRYYETTSHRYLLLDKQLKKVNRKRNLLRAFASHKRDIRKFIREHDIRYKKATNFELTILMNYCNELSSNNN